MLQAVYKAAINPAEFDPRLKAASGMSEGVDADGGYLVPKHTTEGIIERMYNTGDILSRISKDTVQSNNMAYHAVDETSRASNRNGGVLGYWVAEAGAMTATTPKLRNIDLKLNKVVALAYATDELISDVGALESWLVRTIPNELKFQSEDAIYNGNGVGKPLGFINSPCLVQATRADASKVQVADVLGMYSRRWAGSKNYVWFINQDVFPQILQLNNTYQNMFMPAGYAGAPTNTLLGMPIIETEYAQTLGTLGDIVLADMSQYQAIDKGMESASSIHVQFLTGEMTYRFTYRIDGEPLWNSALTPKNGSNTQSPFVALAATT
jgi:HK97 family phage major capsid protein